MKAACLNHGVLLEYILLSLFMVNGQHENGFFDAANMEPLLETPAFIEGMRIFYELWQLIDLSDPTCSANIAFARAGYREEHAERQYQRGRCVAIFTYQMSEPMFPSMPTSVGSAMVHDTPDDGASVLRGCLTSDDCPRAVPSSSHPGVLINPAPMLINMVSLYSIDKHSLRKQDAYALPREVKNRTTA